MRRLLTMLALAVTIAACDSATPDVTPDASPVTPDAPPVTPDLRAFTVAGVPAGTTVELTDTDTLALPAFGGPATAPMLTVRSTGPIVTVARLGTDIVVRAIAVGEARLEVTASAAGFRDTTVAVSVRVVPGVCPPERPAGARDYFPIEEGATSNYELKTFSRSQQVSLEPLTATILNVRCLRGARRATVRYATPGGFTEDQPLVEDARNVVTFRSTSLGFYSVQAVLDRYSFTAANVLAVSIGVCSPAQSRFEAGIGFTFEGAICGALGGFSGRSITRVP